jgi:hypothetical protein
LIAVGKDVASRGADHARGDGGFGVAEQIGVRIAESDYPFTDHQIRASPHRGDGISPARDADNGNVGGGILPEKGSLHFGVVGQGDGDGFRAGHDVLIRDDDAVGPDQEAGAIALDDLFRLTRHEKEIEGTGSTGDTAPGGNMQ